MLSWLNLKYTVDIWVEERVDRLEKTEKKADVMKLYNCILKSYLLKIKNRLSHIMNGLIHSQV
jgi:hypothetical protein